MSQISQISWKAAVTGDWTDGDNWTSGAAPTADDDVTIDLAGGYAVFISSPVVAHNIWFSGPFVSLIEKASGSFTISDPAAQLFVFDGYVELNGANSFSNALDLGGSGVLEVGNSHALGNSLVQASGGELWGTADVSLANAMDFYSGTTSVSAVVGTLTVAGVGHVEAGATLDIGTTSTGLRDGAVVWTGPFQNDGFVRISAGSLHTSNIVNNGIVEGDKEIISDHDILWTEGDSLWGGSGDNVFALAHAPDYVDGGAGDDTIDVQASMTFSAGSVVNVETFKIENGVAADLSALTSNETIVFGTTAAQSASVKGGQGTDTAVFSATLAGATIVHNSDGTVTIATANGGRDTLSGVEYAQFADQRVSLAPVSNRDFNGDAKADILWRNSNGGVELWNANGSGGFTYDNLGAVKSSWSIAGTGDFNGAGAAGILWRNANGSAELWNANGSGGFTYENLGVVNTSWRIVGTGDFAGNGQDGILWCNQNGDMELWNANGAGGFTYVGLGPVDNSWQIAGTGDFNGDGSDDILWRNTNGDTALWNANASGGFTYHDLGAVNTSWQIAGTGDFAGDGQSGILWRKASGATELWSPNGSGGFTYDYLGVVSTSWEVVGTGDFTGAGRSGILWRNTNGATELWNPDGSGGFAYDNLGIVSPSWAVHKIFS
ncbi:MAG TPA: hypothetical protein VGG79_04140 [Roseiarcus sp.]|jgi:hypothetical protein